jgi:hypothetical protein
MQTCLFPMLLKNPSIEIRIDPKIGFGLHDIQQRFYLRNDLVPSFTPHFPKEAWAISRELQQNLSNRFSRMASISWIVPLWWQQTRGKLSLPRRVWMFCRLLLL